VAAPSPRPDLGGLIYSSPRHFLERRKDRRKSVCEQRAARTELSIPGERGGAFTTECSRETRTRSAFSTSCGCETRVTNTRWRSHRRANGMAKLREFRMLIAISSPSYPAEIVDSYLSLCLFSSFNFFHSAFVVRLFQVFTRISSFASLANFAIRKARSKSHLYFWAKQRFYSHSPDCHRGRTGHSYFVMLTSDVRGSGTSLEFYKPRKSETEREMDG